MGAPYFRAVLGVDRHRHQLELPDVDRPLVRQAQFGCAREPGSVIIDPAAARPNAASAGRRGNLIGAGVELQPYGPVMVRGMPGPPTPYIPSGAYG